MYKTLSPIYSAKAMEEKNSGKGLVKRFRNPAFHTADKGTYISPWVIIALATMGTAMASSMAVYLTIA